jgi:hypothetical protein
VLSTRSCQILMKLEYFQKPFEKCSNARILRKSAQWEPSCCMRTDIRTDRRDDANSRFRNFADAPKNDVLECLTGILYVLHGNTYTAVSNRTEQGRHTKFCTQMLTLKIIHGSTRTALNRNVGLLLQQCEDVLEK